MTLATGQLLQDRYRIDGLLSGGGMGAVYRAWDLNLNRPVVVKENRLYTPEAQRQFEREARLLANLKHPHLPRVSDHFFLPGQGQYLVMDYIEGEDLNQRLARGGPVPAGQAVEWMVQVLDALEYLHSREPAVIHRDVKPANVKITPEGKVWLVDFGLAKVYDPGKETTMGARGVTPGYAPVEQYGYGRTDVRTDVYSLGATLYALLAGQAPPEAPELVAGDARLVPLRELAPEVPVEVEGAVLRAMENAPRDRFQTAGEFRAALAATFPGPGMGTAGSPAGGAAVARGRVPAWAWSALGGALAVAVVIVLVIMAPWGGQDDQARTPGSGETQPVGAVGTGTPLAGAGAFGSPTPKQARDA
jgi:serine/threonine protein kinase